MREENMNDMCKSTTQMNTQHWIYKDGRGNDFLRQREQKISTLLKHVKKKAPLDPLNKPMEGYTTNK